MDKYIADKKVVAVEELVEIKTPLENVMLKLIYEDGSIELMPKVRFDLLATDVISDLTEVQNKVRARVAAMLFSTLHEYGVKMGEVNGISDAMFDLINNGYERAKEVKFGYEHLELPLIVVNNILKDATKNSDGATSTGSRSNTQN